MPAELGLADHPGALAVSPDGTQLFAASGIGAVARYVVSDITTYGPGMPEARTVISLGDGNSGRAGIDASNDVVVVALGSRIWYLDPVTLAVRDQLTEHQLLAEMPVPDGAAEITRIAPSP